MDYHDCMPDSRWDRIASLFDEAQHLMGEERSHFLDVECGDDQELRAEVESMLEAGERAGFLLTPVPSQDEGDGPLVGATIGGFRILRLLGEGGMGAVYEAEQNHPLRRVALKVLRSALASMEVRRRFEVEAELLGRLHHPNIAQVYEAGVHVLEGGFELPYFAMEYIAGARHLTRYAEEEDLDLRARIELMTEVCDAVVAAHQRGILHRDLKPSNLLVDRDARVRVIDFGVARATEDDRLVTKTGEVIGTPAYMSPEQLSGRPEKVDVRSDVWALGVVLYRLTTRSLPFETEGVAIGEMASRLEIPPTRVSRRNPGLPRDLDWIVERALEHDPKRRYGSVSELGDELQRLLANEPVFAGPTSRLYRIRKFARRNRLLVIAASIIVIALLSGTILATAGLLRARTAESAAKLDAQAAMNEASKFEGINSVLRSMFTSFDATQVGAEARVVDLLDTSADSLTIELQQQPAVRKALHLVLAQSYDSLGEAERTLAQVQQVLDIGRSQGALDDSDELDAVRLGLESSLALGDTEGSREFLELGREMMNSFGLQESEAALLLGLGEARILIRERQLASAIEILQELKSRAEEADRTSSLFEIANLLAFTLYEKQRFEEARTLYVEFLAQEPPEGRTAMAYRQMQMGFAKLLHTLDESEEGLRLMETVAPAIISATGKDSVHSQHALNLSAEMHLALDRPETARAILETLLEGAEKDSPGNRGEVLHARRLLSLALAATGDTRRSERDMRKVLEVTLDLYGPDHRFSAGAMTTLGIHLIGERRFEEAEEYLLEALRIRKHIGPTNNIHLLQVLARLGELYVGLEQYERAFSYLDGAWTGFDETLGPGSEYTIMAGTNAITALSGMGDLKSAASLAEALYEETREAHGAADRATLAQAGNLSVIYQRLARDPESEAVLIDAIQAAREAGGQSLAEFADLLYGRARQLRRLELPDEARMLLEEALSVLREVPRVNPLARDSMRAELGRALNDLESHHEAFQQLIAAHRGLTRHFSPEDHRIRKLVEEIAATLEVLGREREADSWRKKLETKE